MPPFICEFCNKKYSFPSGLSRHKKSCSNEFSAQKTRSNGDEVEILVNLCKDLVQQNLKSQTANTELVKKLVQNIQPVNKIINKNCSTNISVNVFLNEHCKDAMNIKDFIENIDVSFEDLNYAKNYGSVKSITDILVRNLTSLAPTERPIHCSDRKRLQFYVKDENKWEKDEEHERIEKSIASINRKQLDKLHEWSLKNPDWNKDKEKSAIYLNMVQSIAWMNEQRQPMKNKVKRNISSIIEIKDAIGQTLKKI